MPAHTVDVSYKLLVPHKYIKSQKKLFIYQIIPKLYLIIFKKFITDIELLRHILVLCIQINTQYLTDLLTNDLYNKGPMHYNYYNLRNNFMNDWWNQFNSRNNITNPYIFRRELIWLFNHNPYYRKFKNKKKIIVFLRNIGDSRFFLFIKKHKTRRVEFYNSSELNKYLVYSNELDYILQHNQLQSIDKMLQN